MKTWKTIDEFPLFEINEGKEIRRRAHTRNTTIQCVDETGNVIDEYSTTKEHKPKLMQPTKMPFYAFRKGGKQYGRSIYKLYRQYILGEDVTPKNKMHRRKLKLKF